MYWDIWRYMGVWVFNSFTDIIIFILIIYDFSVSGDIWYAEVKDLGYTFCRYSGSYIRTFL